MNENYKIISKIGQGAFGNVFLVNNSRKENLVIKSIPLKQFTRYVNNELEILKNLDHPRIIKFIEFFPSKNDYNFVMEYAENGTLRTLIFRYQERKWKMTGSDLVEIFMDIAYGLKFLHSKNIIHRDVKPENILMTSDYRIKLADFGVSKIVSDCFPQVHTSIGSLAYMSPEVYLHRPYGKKCDIWALGLIFYEMAMMKYPFTQVDRARILNSVLTFTCPKVDWISRKYDPNYQQVLEMMLQRDPEKRKDISTICRFPSFARQLILLENEYIMYCVGKRNELASKLRLEHGLL
ncbi:serine/threonine-protein kinase Nek5-like [Chironomus tepperi]|uniref:serine/threonine-protein kinase Nek5-like n=1 Tax=Chironomus tepperi TaxID=113505 RepID=UPI00391F9BC6